MKNISYLDMVKEILNESEFFQFEKCYNNPIKKSIKILNHRGYKNNKSDSHNIVQSIISQERDLSGPEFSYNGNKYNDVLFATRKENLKSSSLGSHYLHQAGLIYVQEMAASLSVQMLGIESGDYVLDMCAAPGGKSIQIADRLSDGFLISNEIDKGRKKALESNLHRCGIFNVGVVNQDGCKLGDMFSEVFDKVLVDAPCSGEGMQYKSDKKVRQRDEKKSKNLSDLQTKLLISGLKSLKVGGELVYSTCTTNVLENEFVVSEVLKQYGDKIELLEVPLDEKSVGITNWRGNIILSENDAIKVARLWPHIHQTGGFFIAKFKKIKSFEDKNGTKNNRIETKDNEIRDKLSSWGINKIPDLDFYISKFTINVAPKSLIEKCNNNNIFNIEIGLPVFKIVDDNKNHTQKLIPLVGVSQIFGHLTTHNVIEIDNDQLKSLMEKRDLIDDKIGEYEGNYVIVRWNGIGVGLVSVQKGVGKNKCF